MDNHVLDKLVQMGILSHYTYDIVDENGNVGEHSEFRNTERLCLIFPSGQKLIIDTFCSGSAEDTSLEFDLVIPQK